MLKDKKNKKVLVGDKDILSSFHESNVSHEERKKLGQFYTHQTLVNYIFENIPINENSKILDPSVGAGAFLITALNFNNKNADNIYGIDIDNAALKLCIENVEDNVEDVKNDNFICSNTLNYELWELFPQIYNEGGFDIIIGNPPYQHLVSKKDFNPENSLYKPVINGVTNSATLMIAKSIDFLKEDGYLGFVLPKGILRVDSFLNLRKFILNNLTIMNIVDLGHYFKDVRGDQIILILKKTKPINFDNKISIKILSTNKDFIASTDYFLPQKELFKYDYFHIYKEKSFNELADKLFKITETLETITDGNIFRGLNLSSKSPAISKDYNEELKVVYRGDSLKKFGIKYPLYLDLNKFKEDKSKFEKLNNEKIILQNLCSKEAGITATISSCDEYNIDTVTNIITDKIDLKFLLGIINSNFASFFLLHLVFLSSNFTMHTDKKYIGKLPIVIPNKSIVNKVIKIVEQILKLNGEKNNDYKKLYLQLNNLVYSIYNLSNEEIEIIENCLSKSQSQNQYYGTKNE
jgi:hypothetical protein